MATKTHYWATGRRKTATARVRLIPGEGRIRVNERELDDYFPMPILREKVLSPLRLTDTVSEYDIIADVKGGGISGQAGALRHGIARGLQKVQPELRDRLKKRGFLTRDPRMKERRKYGLKKARKAPQFSKR